MAKPTGPVLAFGTSGTVGDRIVHATRRGRAYARSYAVPFDPNTAGQVETRNIFKTLNATYKDAPTGFNASWLAGAKGKPLTDRNLWVGLNLPQLRGQISFAGIVLCAPSGGGPQIQPLIVTPGTGDLAVQINFISIPSGWSILTRGAAAIPLTIPTGGAAAPIAFFSHIGRTITLSGLVSGVTYEVAGWIVWQKPGSRTAYGPAQNATGIPL